MKKRLLIFAVVALWCVTSVSAVICGSVCQVQDEGVHSYNGEICGVYTAENEEAEYYELDFHGYYNPETQQNEHCEIRKWYSITASWCSYCYEDYSLGYMHACDILHTTPISKCGGHEFYCPIG